MTPVEHPSVAISVGFRKQLYPLAPINQGSKQARTKPPNHMTRLRSIRLWKRAAATDSTSNRIQKERERVKVETAPSKPPKATINRMTSPIKGRSRRWKHASALALDAWHTPPSANPTKPLPRSTSLHPRNQLVEHVIITIDRIGMDILGECARVLGMFVVVVVVVFVVIIISQEQNARSQRGCVDFVLLLG